MRQTSRLLIIIASIVAPAYSDFVGASSSVFAVDASSKVQPGETVGDVLSGERPTEDSAKTEASPLGAFLRLLGAVAGIGALGFVVVWLWRRGLLGKSTGRGTRALEVIGRAPLSPRHSVCLVRVGARRVVVVGMCGDAMSSLASIDDPEELAELLTSTGVGREAREIEIDSVRMENRNVRGRGGLVELLATWRKGLSSAGAGGKR